MIPLSNTDNMRDLISNQSCENLTVRESMINYESIDKAWKSSVKYFFIPIFIEKLIYTLPRVKRISKSDNANQSL